MAARTSAWASSARLNLTVMIAEMARRIHQPRLLAPPRQARSIFMDGFKELRVAFTPEAFEGASTSAGMP